MRLIDADALMREYNMRRGDCSECPFSARECHLYNWTKMDVCGLLDDAPTIDAVEVVRCKDCKHYRPGTGLNAGHGWCNEPPLGTALAVSEDFFCKYGKRKEGAEK